MKKILIVEDDKGIAEISRLLFQALGYTALVAHTKDAAVTCLETNIIDLVILDGDIGDGKYDETSLTGCLILTYIEPLEIPYGRYTGQPSSIPERLHGEICVMKPETKPLLAFVKQKLGHGDSSGEETVST
jgi:hypothetical protein